jgi:hypothetical protein
MMILTYLVGEEENKEGRNEDVAKGETLKGKESRLRMELIKNVSEADKAGEELKSSENKNNKGGLRASNTIYFDMNPQVIKRPKIYWIS